MRYVFIPLPLITGGKPGLVYCPVVRGSGSGSGGISASTFGTRLAPDAGSLERIFEAALSPSAPQLIYPLGAALFNSRLKQADEKRLRGSRQAQSPLWQPLAANGE